MHTLSRRSQALVVLACTIPMGVRIVAQHPPPFVPLVVDPGVGWSVEHAAPDRPSIQDGGFRLSAQNGLLRTTRPLFGDFRIRFEMQTLAGRTEALVAMLGRFPAEHFAGAALVVPLLSARAPTKVIEGNIHFDAVVPNSTGIEKALQPAGEWQSYELAYISDNVTLVLNGSVIVSERVASKSDGWIGFQTFGGDIIVRNLQIADLTASRELTGEFYRPGNGVSYPVKLSEVKPAYSAEAMRAKTQGVVLMECIVLPDGTVGDVRVARSLDSVNGLDQHAVKAVRQWRFRPGMRMGEPVPVAVMVETTFTLR